MTHPKNLSKPQPMFRRKWYWPWSRPTNQMLLNALANRLARVDVLTREIERQDALILKLLREREDREQTYDGREVGRLI
mgnify:CR=1 FL=1